MFQSSLSIFPMDLFNSFGFLFSRYLVTLSRRDRWCDPEAYCSMILNRSSSLMDFRLAELPVLALPAFFFSLADCSARCIKLSSRFRLADRFIRAVSLTFSLLWDSPPSACNVNKINYFTIFSYENSAQKKTYFRFGKNREIGTGNNEIENRLSDRFIRAVLLTFYWQIILMSKARLYVMPVQSVRFVSSHFNIYGS